VTEYDFMQPLGNGILEKKKVLLCGQSLGKTMQQSVGCVRKKICELNPSCT